MDTSHPILFFDGVCKLCIGSVRFILRNDRNEVLRFATLQSDAAAELLKPLGIDPQALDSVVLYDNGKLYTHSDSVLHTFQLMGGPWAYLASLDVVPHSFRDLVYHFISRNRYQWFGERETRMVPPPEYAARFLAV